MNKPFFNDQAYIAEEFIFRDDHVSQTARLAFFKINSYKLSLINSAFCMSRDELTGNLKDTLFNYTDSTTIMSDTGFFDSPFEQ